MLKGVVWMWVVDGKCRAHSETAAGLSRITGAETRTIQSAVSNSNARGFDSMWKRVSREEYDAEWTEEAVRRKLRAMRYCDRCAAVLPDPVNYARATVSCDPRSKTYRLCPSCYDKMIQFVEGDLDDMD